MSPSTISYGLMTLTLGSMTAFAITNSEALTDPFRETRVFASAMHDSQPTMILPAKIDAACTSTDSCCDATPAPASASTIVTDAKVALSPALAAGMSAAEVRTTLGEPDSISADGARWTYGSSIFIFSNDRLAGQVSYDPVQAALNKYNHVISTLNTSSDAPAVKSTGPKVLTAKAMSGKYSKYLHRPIAAGSARNAYRYDRNQKEYSYYMNRSGPMDRIFTGKRFLPRGMMNSTERNLGQSYLNYGAARYSNSSATQYRR